MYYTGLDAHPKRSQLQHIDEDGALGLCMNIPTTPEGFNRFLDKLNGPTRITFEASCCYWWLHEYFKNHPKVAGVNVVDPRRSRKLSEELSVQRGYGRAKNDRIDTEMMAEQDRLGLAPTIHVPTAEQLKMRTLNRHRFILVFEKTTASNRIYGLLSMHGVFIVISKFVDDSDYRNQILQPLPPDVQFIVQNFVVQVHGFEKQIQSCEDELDKVLPLSHPDIKLLMTIPGFGPVLSRIVKTEILDIHNFRVPKYLISYSGLAPIDQESAGKKGVIKLNRHCNYYLKYAFTEAAHNARNHPHYKRKYDYDVKKHGKIIAKLNLARRFAKTVFWMLVRQQPYKF
ncbi:MAG: IS110 family transposase [candidate division KSB1 bacterium]|nr:IS110 family transposase [candidate division KSB1 bacterium]MDZ7365346.1 IS110 family transposase [candidate division KSB1 bacterium]MDZ7407449.1 IS110 family transposase [candidate division KSB1 bacterium]